MATAAIFLALSLGAGSGASVAASPGSEPADQDTAASLPASEPIAPLPAPVVAEPEKTRLGERLFRDPRLSRDGTLACISCHRLEASGADSNGRAIGADGKLLDYNAPTVFNAALNFRLNWRGNFRSLEELVEAVLLDQRLMNMSWEDLLVRLRADRSYRLAFTRVYGGITRTALLDALSAFQRSLLTPDAPFDRFLRGKRDALTPDQERGYALFKAYGCVACHQGVNVGGNLFQKFGVFAQPAAATPADLGRFSITGEERDRHVFRVPSLRNVALTAPYFHDGGTPILAEAVRTMGRSQVGRTLSETEIDLIVQFLQSLTGKYEGRALPTGAAAPAMAPP